jgi:tol-pal system protein YbgF
MRLQLIPALLLLAVPATSFAQKKDQLVELGRDLALLQEEVRNNQKAQDERLAAIDASLKSLLDQVGATRRAVAALDLGLKDRLDKSVVGPVSAVGVKVDTLSQDFGYVRETVAEINTRLGKLQQKVVDLENTIKTMQALPAAPGAVPAASAPGPPPGLSSETLYNDAMRDKSGRNFDLALKEFTDYLAWFGSTDLAPNAQFYIGEILYNQKQYEDSIKAFDKVLEAYSKNPKTQDAHLMKGRALLKLGERNEAAQEFRTIISSSPNSDAAARARAELKELGASTATAPPKKPVKK